MYDWIIEADAYRLRKQADEALDPAVRRELERRAERKVQLLAERRGDARAKITGQA